MSGLRVAAFDLSLTSTGVAVVEHGRLASVDRLQPKGKVGRGYPRLRHIRSTVLDVATLVPADVVAVEGPAFGAQGDAYHQLAGLWWLVTEALHATGIPLVVVPPATVKTFATGKGNAGKDLVLAAAVRRFVDVPIDGNDQADAAWIAALVAHHYGTSVVSVPEINLRALAKVEFPALPPREDPA